MNESMQGNSLGADQHTAQRVAQKAHEVIDKVAEQAEMAEQRLRGAYGDASSRLQLSGDELKERYGDINTRIVDYVHEHPLASLGVAFGAGVLLAAMLRR